MAERPLILITNDDGIESPGIAAAVAALDPLGDLLIVAPDTQQSAMGRSMPLFHDGRIFETSIRLGDRTWTAYRVVASPAQAVQYATLELADRRPALAVSGINYGENIGTGITVSGTVGAALEASAFNIPALAVSLQVDPTLQLTHDPTVDFTVAAHFTHYFAQLWLSAAQIPDVDLLKIDIPAAARLDTRWRITHLARHNYYRAIMPQRLKLSDPARIGYELDPDVVLDDETDAGALTKGFISVTPLSLDLTSRIHPSALSAVLDGKGQDDHDSLVS
jgi:5'-nucleotidase